MEQVPEFNSANSPISVGSQHYSIIDDQGILYMGGSNLGHQLGIGTDEDVKTPIRLPFDKRVISVSCGDLFTIAITEDGKIYGWGGVIGGSGEPKNVPTIIEALESYKAVKVSCGGGGWAVILDDGSIHYSVLGKGVMKLETKGIIPSEDKIIDISADGYHFAAITKSGKLYFFGEERITYSVSIGAGIFSPRPRHIHLPLKPMVPGGTIESIKVKQVSLTQSHIILLSKNGDVFVWGKNKNCLLGLNKCTSTPTYIIPQKLTTLPKISCIESHHTVSAAITTDGRLYVWGYYGIHDFIVGVRENDRRFGRLHKPERFIALHPIEIEIGCRVNYIALGSDLTIITTKDGIVNYIGNSEYSPNPSDRPSIGEVIQVLTGSLSQKIICSNQKSIQGWDIQKYNPSDLIHYQEKGETYCFLKSDVSFLQQGLNPFTGRKIRPGILKEFIRLAKEKKLFDPYGVTLPKGIKTKCPLFVSHDPLIGYYYHCEGISKFVTKSVSPGQDSDANCVGLLYQTTFRRPLSMEDMDQYGFIRADESNIVSDKLILDLKSLEVDRPLANRVLKETSDKTYSVYNSMDDDTEHFSLRGALQEFMNSGHIVLPSQAIQDILVQKIRPSEPITLFRGLSWNEWSGLTFEKWMNQIGRKKISIGDELEIIDTRVASWSANICISSTFSSGNYGIVFSYQAQPNEIMLDVRMLADREKFYQHDQAEVMLLPGRKKNHEWGGPITRRVKVEMVVWNRGQRTPSGFLLKEKPTEQYNLWVKELIIP